MDGRIYVTEFGTLAMPFHTGCNYTIAIVDLHHNRVSKALLPDTPDKDGLPTYAPTFDSYDEALVWLDRNYTKLF